MRNIIIIAVLALFIGCNQKSMDEENNQSTTNSETQKVETKNDTMTVAVFNTNMGKFEAELYPDKAPKAVENFTGLAEKNYYKGVIFHRVIPGFMIQGGDPTGSGRGGQSIWGKSFEDEVNTGLIFDSPGVLAMANAGPNTNGSQFFITVAPTPWLNGYHTIFGKIISGMDVVNSISTVQRNAQDKPLKDVVIQDIKIEKRTGQ
ncbi:MAG TPA: peptidylprolyl isomerase [Ignavibacteriaceae bacterium]|nr:peptidylprolyl isomerase [Ignavibacteriaceae bacterium]